MVASGKMHLLRCILIGQSLSIGGAFLRGRCGFPRDLLRVGCRLHVLLPKVQFCKVHFFCKFSHVATIVIILGLVTRDTGDFFRSQVIVKPP